MSKQIINEGLDYHDLVGQIKPTVTVDEYAAKMGKDSDIVTLAFIMNSEAAGNDIVDWFERGYDFVLDASLGDGEISPGKYIVFVEMNRRTSVPARIIELLEDLQTLTDIPLKDWTIEVDEEEYEPDENILKQVIVLSPHAYREKEESEEAKEKMNEMRDLAGLEPRITTKEQDSELKAFKAMAGL